MTFETLKSRDQDRVPWTDMQVAFWRLSTAHSQYLTVKAFHDDLRSPRSLEALDTESRAILWKLFRLYGICIIETAAHEFNVSSALDVQKVERMVGATKPGLLKELRPHAVRLVDAWKLPDWLLDSSLGRYDGRVYEDLFRRASQLNPVNSVTPDLAMGSLAVAGGPLSNAGRSRL